MPRTGHWSTAVRAYKRPGSTLVKAVSDTLQPPAPASEEPSEKASGEPAEKAKRPGTNTTLVLKHGETSVKFNFN